jgi:formate hydrogenlyase subunit 6/NADH:ubiquinone oxidoreductase subunit I
VEACPVEAIDLAPKDQRPKDGKRAVHDDSLCLGCGVCYSACRFGGITMKPRKQRVYTPETVFDRFVSMAIERGKLVHLLFDAPERLTHRALGRVLAVLEKSPPFKAAMAIKPLRSVFLNAMVKGAKKNSGELADVFA